MSVVLVQGASKGIGFSLVKQFLLHTNYKIVATARTKETFQQSLKNSNIPLALYERVEFIPVNTLNEKSIESCADKVLQTFGQKSLKCVVNSSGYLLNPEKTIRNVDFNNSMDHFLTNAIGPMMFAKYFTKLMAPAAPNSSDVFKHALWINLSARTGSIGDNKLGGWYSYRMSKAALNQLTKCLSVELKSKNVIVCSLHPGTVDTDLSRNYTKNAPNIMHPDDSAAFLFNAMKQLDIQDSGSFKDYKGTPIVY